MEHLIPAWQALLLGVFLAVAWYRAGYKNGKSVERYAERFNAQKLQIESRLTQQAEREKAERAATE